MASTENIADVLEQVLSFRSELHKTRSPKTIASVAASVALSLNAAVPESIQAKIAAPAGQALQAARQHQAEVVQTIHSVFGAEETNLNSKEAVILGRNLVTEKGIFAVASQVIHEFGGAGALIQTNSMDAPLVNVALSSRYKNDEIVIAGSYPEAIQKLKALGFTSFHFILSEEDASPEIRTLGRVTILTDQQISGLISKFESMIQTVLQNSA